MSATALLVADASPEDGLGHVSRLSAIAVALRSRSIGTRCHANGLSGPLERDGVTWTPLAPASELSDVDVAIVDSYRLEPASVVAANVPLVVFRDQGDAQPAPSLVVSVAAPPSDDPSRLSGPRYAALRPAYWGLPPREASGALKRILVTTGAGDPDGIGAAIARAVAVEFPGVDVILVRGPHAPALSAGEVTVCEALDSLFDELLAADLVICGAGQTMLEAAACGTPCVSFVLADNQRGQGLVLASSGAVALVDPADADQALAVVRDLDSTARDELSRCAQRAVDGYGALRIAYRVEALLRETA